MKWKFIFSIQVIDHIVNNSSVSILLDFVILNKNVTNGFSSETANFFLLAYVGLVQSLHPHKPLPFVTINCKLTFSQSASI